MTDKNPVAPLGAAPAGDEKFKISSLQPSVRFLSRGVQPPTNVYVEVGDLLSLFCASSAVGERVKVNYRLLRFDGLIINGAVALLVPSDRSVVNVTEPLAEGFLLSATCTCLSATTRGQTFARLFLLSSTTTEGRVSPQLCADYITTQSSASYPDGRQMSPAEGPGRNYTVAVPDPGFGAQVIVFSPNNALWKIRGAFFNLLTSAVVGNRYVQINQTSMGGFCTQTLASQLVTANLSVEFGASPFPNTSTLRPVVANIPIVPDIIMRPGNLFRIASVIMDAGDQFQGINLAVEEWLENV